MAWDTLTLAAILNAVLLGRSLATLPGCTFPKFAQNQWEDGTEWITRETRDVLGNIAYLDVGIVSNTITAKPTSWQLEQPLLKGYNRTCMVEYENATYLILHESEIVSYNLCVQFIYRDNNVFQMSESSKITNGLHQNCTNVTYVLDPWPYLNRKALPHAGNPCPFPGGYDVTYYDSENNLLCDPSDYPNRFEMDCSPGEGITFGFRGCFRSSHRRNILTGLMSADGTNCRAQWHQGQYTFFIFGILATSTQWIGRYKTENASADNLDVYIFTDIVADVGEPITGKPRETSRYMRALLFKRIFSSLCADLKHNCPERRTHCNAKIGVWCRKSCNLCSDDNEKRMYCKFSRRYRGKWLYVEENNVQRVTVDESFFNMSYYENFRCAKMGGVAKTGKVYTVAINDNGCTPRYTCFQFQKKGSVLKYKMGNPAPWPASKYQVCSTDKFEEDYTKSYQTYRGDMFRHLVAAGKVKAVDCKLPGAFTFRTNTSTGDECLATLKPMASQHNSKMALIYTYCPGEASVTPPMESYTCVLSDKDTFSRYSFQYVIAVRDANPRLSSCWIIHTLRYEDELRIFRVPTGECKVTEEGYFSDVERLWPSYPVLKLIKHEHTHRNATSRTVTKTEKNHNGLPSNKPTALYSFNQTVASSASFYQCTIFNIIIIAFCCVRISTR